MSKALRYIVAFLLSATVLFGIAIAENLNSHNITIDLGRIKTQHDNGFVKEETLDKSDLHYGWGLGVFYVQGYSKMTYDADNVPVFLLQDNDQIMLGFNLKQKLDALGGNSNYTLNGDSNGYDSVFGVERMDFGKGCLIIQKTDSANNICPPEIYPNYLLNTAENSASSLIGPLTEGDYSGTLDYEIRFSGIVSIPGYNDYKIPFHFKIQNINQYYATAAISTNITKSGTQTITIVIAIISILIATSIFFVLARKRQKNPKHSSAIDASSQDSSLEELTDTTDTDNEKLDKCDKQRKPLKKWQIVGIFAIILAICICIISPILSNPSSYPSTIRYLDERFTKTNTLMLGTASASFIISFIPDDAGTPVANELAKISGYMLLVLSAILLEKYLLTSIAFVACTLVPTAAFVMGVLWVYLKDGHMRLKAAEFAVRLIIFAICLVLIIPLGCACGRAIESINETSINLAIKDAEEANKIVDSLPESEEDRNIIQKAIDDLIKGLKQKIEWAKELFANFMRSTAVMLITTIAIPILILFCFIWLIRFLTKKDFTHAILSFSKKFANKTADTITSIGKQTNDHDE